MDIIESDDSITGKTKFTVRKRHEYPVRALSRLEVTLGEDQYARKDMPVERSGSVRMIERSFYGEEGPLLANRYFETWSEMKKRGLPVVDKMLQTTDPKVLLMSDLESHGATVYGKGAISGSQSGGLHAQLDKIFVTVPLDEIRSKASALSNLATAKSVSLPLDDCFIVSVQPDGSWDLIILDLEDARCHPMTAVDPVDKIIELNNAAAIKQGMMNIKRRQNIVREEIVTSDSSTRIET